VTAVGKQDLTEELETKKVLLLDGVYSTLNVENKGEKNAKRVGRVGGAIYLHERQRGIGRRLNLIFHALCNLSGSAAQEGGNG